MAVRQGDDAYQHLSKEDLIALLNKAENEKATAQVQTQKLQQQIDSSSKLKSAVSLASSRAKQAKSIDVCFTLDCTSSMASYLDAAQSKILQIHEFLLAYLGTGANMRFSVAGYRDYEDKPQFTILPFTDAAGIVDFLKNIKTYGGQDDCEDVVGGLEKAIELDWQSTTRIIYLLCDAPSHGRRFHDIPFTDGRWNLASQGLGSKSKSTGLFGRFTWREWTYAHDDHLDDPRQWEPADAVFTRMKELNIHFVGLDVSKKGTTSSCDKMYEVFKSLHSCPERALTTQILDFDGTAAEFARCVISACTSSLKSTLDRLCEPANEKSTRKMIHLDLQDLDWRSQTSWPEHSVSMKTVVVRNLKEGPQTNSVARFVRICPHPFAKGAMRYAFAAWDVKSDSKLVAKSYQFDGGELAEAWAEADVLGQAYAKFFADEFSARVPNTPIQFVQAQLLTLVKTCKHYSVEPFIPGEYEKYTSNAGYVAKNSQLAQSFTHFTWQFSAGEMMVTDIQGVSTSVLTDPQIHSPGKSAFGRGNLGEAGMDRFFLRHSCNDICKYLNLKRSPIQIEGAGGILEDEDEGWIKVTTGIMGSDTGRSSEVSPLLCEGKCGSAVPIAAKDYVKQKKKFGGIMCNTCLEKMKSTICAMPCATLDCKRKVTYSSHALDTSGSQRPVQCFECRSTRKETVVLLQYSRNPRPFHELLQNGETLKSFRMDLEAQGFKWRFHSGAYIFVQPSHYEPVVKQIDCDGLELGPGHIIVGRELEDLLVKEIMSLPRKHKINLQTRTEIRSNSARARISASDNEGNFEEHQEGEVMQAHFSADFPVIVQRTFLHLHIPSSLLSDVSENQRTVSTTDMDSSKGSNPRRVIKGTHPNN